MTNLDGLDVGRLITLLYSYASQRERDARFYRDLSRAEVVDEQRRATSDVVLLSTVLDRLQSPARDTDLQRRDAIARAYVEAFRAFHRGDEPDPELADALNVAEYRLLQAYTVPEKTQTSADDATGAPMGGDGWVHV